MTGTLIEAVSTPASASSVLRSSPSRNSIYEAFTVFSAAARSLEHSYFALSDEVRRLRAELARERDLRQRREALAEMSTLLAHEVRNPIASLELFAALLGNANLWTEDRNCVEQIQGGLRVLSATVQNVLEFHTPSCSALKPSEICEVLRRLQSLLVPMAARASFRLLFELPGAIWILANRQHLEQAFLNLSLNAFRFATEGKLGNIGAAFELRLPLAGVKSMSRSSCNRSRAAEMLGISLHTVRNKIRAHKLPSRTAYGNIAH